MKLIEAQLEEVLGSLKDFQTATVEHVFKALFDQPRGKMLVADEVGLGKTVVAKGLIAKAIQRSLKQGKTGPFQVVYVCSNQAIAQENQQKLQVFPEDNARAPLYGRIAELAFQPPESKSNYLQINSLTPATSFKITSGPGNWVERMVVYRLLLRVFPKKEKLLAEWMRYGVEPDSWARKLQSWAGQNKLRPGLADRFCLYLSMQPVAQFSEDDFAALDHNPEDPLCLRRAVELLLVQFSAVREVESVAYKLRILLRKALVECCLDYIQADLFILDEFQRFRNLLVGAEEENVTEEARIANIIFSKQNARILLLSATPFKAFSGKDDQETGEAHFQELNKILTFLAETPDDLQEFEEARLDIYYQLAELGHGNISPRELSDTPKKKLENFLSRYICRTERSFASSSGNLMLQDTWREIKLPFSKSDIETFRTLDRLSLCLTEVSTARERPVGGLDYAKSAAYPLSFLDGYQFKELLRKYQGHKSVQSALSKSKSGWLNDREINSYNFDILNPKENTSAGNARLTQLVGEALGEHGHELLWIPPSLPYYQLSGAFADQEKFTKTLVFSCWQLVPKMIGTLLSYEVERRTVARDKKIKVEDRKYFQEERTPRHPRPQLRFRLSKKSGGILPATMSMFTLLYPSWFLADLVDAEFSVEPGRSYEDIRNSIALKITNKLLTVKFTQRAKEGGPKQAWSWLAPIAFDQEVGDQAPLTGWVGRCGGLLELQDSGQDHSSLKRHYQSLEDVLNSEEVPLGLIPDNLAEQLAEMALGSPAVACLRTLRRISPERALEDNMVLATQLASGFVELFNKPEAISAVRIRHKTGFFWQRILEYSGRGCLHALIDEYMHLLAEQTGSINDIRSRFLGSINMFTASVNVDSLSGFRKNKKRKMRCHYAVEMGNQKIDTDEGQKRIINIRESFNSPFRPFVLASTSIGQEGLDFHWYCRRIVHWNLPDNPIDLEQREGRINRYKSLVIRRRLASNYKSNLGELMQKGDVWANLMETAENAVDRSKYCQLQPFWHVEDEVQSESIERLVPIYPFSKEAEKLTKSLRVLSLYRLTFGQPRQQELMEFLLGRDFSPEDLNIIKEKLLINLSPLFLRNQSQ